MPANKFQKAARIIFWTLLIFLLVFIIFGGRFDFNISKKTTAQTAVFGQGTPHFLAKWLNSNCPSPAPCTLGQTRCQNANTQQTCSYNINGCLDWGGNITCPGSCSGGVCVGAPPAKPTGLNATCPAP